jgi:serine/threonine protein kinase
MGKGVVNEATLQRICKGEYQIPSSLEPDLILLLQGMLEPDPKKRIPVTQILQNPWFTDGLPCGVLDMNSRLPEGPEDGQGQVNPLKSRRCACSMLCTALT